MSALITHHDVRQFYHQKYLTGVQNGTFAPYTFPLGAYGSLVLFMYLLIPPRSRLDTRVTRYATFAVVASLHGYMILCTKAYTMATGFGIGIGYGWGLIWAATLLIFARPKTDFRRIKRERGASKTPAKEAHDEILRDYIDRKPPLSTDSGVQRRAQHHEPHQNEVNTDRTTNVESSTSAAQPYAKCSWQSYPLDSLFQRVDWVADLGSNFRGVGWSWKIQGLPSLPAAVQRELSSAANDDIKDYAISRSGIRRFDSKSALLRHNLWLFATAYLLVDFIVTMSHHDPYFWGLFDRAPPSYMPLLLQQSPVFLRSYRSFATMFIVNQALRLMCALGPLFFVGVLGPLFNDVRTEPWFYPDFYGSYGIVFDRGLAGWWGGWWHQIFRNGFESGGRWLCECLGLEKKSATGKAVQVFAAFTLSGLIHASGSYSMLGDNWPPGSFLFFFCQSFGILAEMGWKSALKRLGLLDKIPKRLGQAANFIAVHVWFYYTAHWLTDDWAKGGIWLTEPLPFSPFRWLGLGAGGEGVWCWSWRDGARHSWWHKDDSWWKTGVAF